MSLNVGELAAMLSLDDDRFNRGMDNAEGRTGKLGGAVGKLGMLAAAGMATAGVAAAGFGYKAVMAASDLNETMSKSSAVFKASAGDIEAWANTSAKGFGMSKMEAADAASTFGNLFVQLGTGSSEAAGMSKAMTELAADFGSFHNATNPEVIEAMTAAFRGEYDAVQRFVPTINAAAVETKALAMGLAGSTKELTAQDKALATQKLLMEGAGDAAGDFDRTNKSLANRLKTAKSEASDFTAQVGSKLLPVVLDAWDAMEKFAPVIKDGVGAAFKDAAAAVGPLVEGVRGFFEGAGNYSLSSAFNAGQTEEDMSKFQATLATVGESVGSIVGNLKEIWLEFFGTFTEWVGQNEGRINEWRDKLGEIFGTIVEIVGLAWEAIGVVFTVATGIVTNLWDRFGSQLLEHLATAFDSILQVLGGVFEVIKGIFNVFIGVFTGDWTRAWEGIKSIFSGLWDVIVGVVRFAINLVSTVIGAAMATISAIWGYAWRGIQGVFSAIWDGIVGYVKGQIDLIVGIVRGLGGLVTGAVSGAFDGIKSAFRAVVNWIIEKWNGLSFGIPAVEIPGIGKVGGMSLDTPNLPMLARGGTAIAPGLAIVGERGPELLAMNRGASVIPLDRMGQNSGPQVVIESIEIIGVRDGQDVVRVLPELQSALAAGVGRNR